jgi:uncharacterized membrane protein
MLFSEKKGVLIVINYSLYYYNHRCDYSHFHSFAIIISVIISSRVMREKGFDRHTASVYLIMLKGLGMLNDTKHKLHNLSETVDNG